MDNIRIGNSVHVTWRIWNNNGSKYALTGRVQRLWLSSAGLEVGIETYETWNRNELTFTVDKDQLTRYGTYKLILQLRESESEMEDASYELTQVFQVVSQSYPDANMAIGGTVEVAFASVLNNVVIDRIEGLSAYEIAVNHGFEGSEEDWIGLYNDAVDGANSAAIEANAARIAIEAQEGERTAAEAGRVFAEASRVSAESARVSAESARVSAESARADAEAGRVTAENGRVDAESSRVSAESSRVSAENSRVSAESSRVSAESARATRSASDHTRAENDHSLAVSDHSTASSDHTTAAGDHTTAVSDHTRAENDHTTAAADHTTAGGDHTTATGDHTQAVADHTQAASDHTASVSATADAIAAAAAATEAAETIDEKIADKADESEVSQLRSDINNIAPETEDLLVNNASRAGSTSNTTTTGRGSAIAQNKTIYAVTLFLGQRAYSTNPISKFKVILRKDTYDGEILGSKEVSFSRNDNTATEITFTFDSPITYSGVVYLTVQADNLIKYGYIADADYEFSAAASYCTETTIDGQFSTTSGSNSKLWAKMNLGAVHKLSVETAQIADEAVTTHKIADDAVTTDKIADDAVTNDQLENGSVSLEKMDDDLQLDMAGVSDVLVEALKEPIKNANYSSTSSTTTITGRGLILTTNKTIYQIIALVGNRSYSTDPISKVKMTLRKDTVTGDVLATKTVDFSHNDNTVHDVVFDLSGSPVTYSGDIYLTIQVNGLAKFYLISSSDYAYSGTTYTTSTDLTNDATYTNSSSTAPLEVMYVDGKKKVVSIGNENIVDLSVTTPKIADGAVTLDKLADEAKQSNENGVSVILPSDIYVVSGRTLQLFYRGIVSAFDPYSYNVEVTVLNHTTGLTVGYAFPRYYEVAATDSNLGDYDLTINVRKNDNSIIATGTSLIHIVAKPFSPGSQKNILVFGASVVSYGFIVDELTRALTLTSGTEGDTTNPKGLGLSNIAFIGRKTGSIVTTVHQEATGGLSWRDYVSAGATRYRFYITDGSGNNIAINETFTLSGATFTVKEKDITDGSGSISCTVSGTPGTISETGVLQLQSGNVNYSSYIVESTNPFYNPNSSQIDFANYCTNYCSGATINVLLSHLGVNSMSGSTWDLEQIIADVKTIARAFHSYNPNGRFVISTIAVPDPTGGFGYNYHADGAISNYYTIVRRFFQFANAINELVKDSEFSGYVVHCPVMPECDGEWMYPKYERKVNNRNTTKEKVGANAYHPSTSNPFGYYMIADAIYQTLCTLI